MNSKSKHVNIKMSLGTTPSSCTVCINSDAMYLTTKKAFKFYQDQCCATQDEVDWPSQQKTLLELVHDTGLSAKVYIQIYKVQNLHVNRSAIRVCRILFSMRAFI